MQAQYNGEVWLDDADRPIQAHGGGILYHEGVYYWYGENKDAPTVNGRVEMMGVNCYSSKDLVNWRFEGVVLKPCPGDAAHPLHPSRVCERPKVLYSRATHRFVMWFHADNHDYTLGLAGVAVSDAPTGPFEFLRVTSPNRRDCRDMQLFADPVSGKAYLVHSGDWNKTLYFSELTDDYLDFTGVCHAALPDQEREAPALLFRDGLYYCVSSGCTGWAPNAALYAISPRIENGWKLIDNPCEGPRARITFLAQSSHLFEADGAAYLLLDHWNPADLRRSGYSILPVAIDGQRMTITWTDAFAREGAQV